MFSKMQDWFNIQKSVSVILHFNPKQNKTKCDYLNR